MASVVQGTNGNYDLAAGSAPLRHRTATCPTRARQLWAHDRATPRSKWRANSGAATPSRPKCTHQIDDAKIEELAARDRPLHRQQVSSASTSPNGPPQARDYVERALSSGLTLSTLLAGRQRRNRSGVRRDCAARSPTRPSRSRLARTLSDLQAVEVDAFIHHAISHHPRAKASRRQARAGRDVQPARCSASSHNCTRESEQLRAQAGATSSSARGMLGKTSEVAAAAEQSAIAMREAAQTAAGPDPRDRGRPLRSRSRVRRRHPRRRPGRARRSRSARRCRTMSRRSNRSSA